MSKRAHFENTQPVSPELQETLRELNFIRHHESPRAFRKDLASANSDLQNKGVLGNLEIVPTHHGLKLKPHHDQSSGDSTNDPAKADSNSRVAFNPGGRGMFNPGAAIFGPGGLFNPSGDNGTPDAAGRRGLGGRSGLYGSNGIDSRNNLYGSSGRYGHSDLDEQRYGNMPPVGESDDRHHRHSFDYGGRSYSGAKGSTHELAKYNANIVAQIARQMGIDPLTAVATMLVESRGNHKAEGDHGASIGLFQLNKNGEGYGLSRAQKEDPYFNTQVALSEFQRRQGQYGSPGEWAAASQRPKHKHQYAVLVNSYLPYAESLLKT
jgi:hypothetical protein